MSIRSAVFSIIVDEDSSCDFLQIGMQGSLSVHGGADVNQGGQAGQGLFDQHRKDVDELQDPVSVSDLDCLSKS